MQDHPGRDDGGAAEELGGGEGGAGAEADPDPGAEPAGRSTGELQQQHGDCRPRPAHTAAGSRHTYISFYIPPFCQESNPAHGPILDYSFN